MKSIVFAAIALIATAVVAQDGTTSVLTNQPTPATATAPATTTTAAAAPVAAPQCSEVAKVAKLAPWQVRRLNRIADRQEARDARKCCCDPCACEKADKCDCCKTRAVVVESRR